MLQLNIVLCDSQPLIWRRALVPATATFAQFHRMLQTLFDWGNIHLHAFYAGAPNARVKIPAKKTLGAYFTESGQTAVYVYDFGDQWEHRITCERVDAEESAAAVPRCLDGANAAPPEDCGGIIGYYELLNAVRNPRHPDHQELREWLGERFDAAHCNLDAINRQLTPRNKGKGRSRA